MWRHHQCPVIIVMAAGLNVAIIMAAWHHLGNGGWRISLASSAGAQQLSVSLFIGIIIVK